MNNRIYLLNKFYKLKVKISFNLKKLMIFGSK